MARRMNSKASYSSIPTLTSKGVIADNDLDKSNMLAEMYAKLVVNQIIVNNLWST